MNFSGPAVIEMWAHLDTTGNPAQAASDACRLIREKLHFLSSGSGGGYRK